MKRLLALTAGFAVALSVAAAVAQQAKQLSITTGGTGGVYYPLGGGFASIIGKNIPNTTAAAEVTGGSVANLQLIGSGRADIAFAQVDASWDAINGTDKFTSGKLPIQSLVVMYPNHMHVVTIDGTGITKIEDLKGKRVATGANIASAMPSLKAAGPLRILLVFIGFSMITVSAFWTPTRLGSR